MAEVETIRVHYTFCELCAQPTKLRWTLSDDKRLTGDRDGYWKIIGHASCRNNGKAGKPVSGAKEAFQQALLERAARFITEMRWPSKFPPQKQTAAKQLSLFR